jgi:hypothetical protein
VAHACNPSYLGDLRSEGSQFSQSRTPMSKITRGKWARGVVQVVEHLLCKRISLSSKPSPTKKQKKESYLIIVVLKVTCFLITNKERG